MILGFLALLALGLFVGRWSAVLLSSFLGAVLLLFQGSGGLVELVSGTALAVLPVALGVSLRVAIFGAPQTKKTRGVTYEEAAK